MDVRQIRDFVAVVRCSSFAAASRDLRISQPGLAYQIKQLEQELRVQLLQRHARGVSLTSAGRTFMGHAERILAAVNHTKVAMAEIANDDRREFSIGLSPSPAFTLRPLLRAGIASHLKVRFQEGYSSDLREAVARGDLDMAICHDVAPRPLKTAPLYSEPLYLIGPVSDRKTSQSDITVAEVARYPLVMGPPDHALRRGLEAAAKVRGIALTIEQGPADGCSRRSLVLRNGCYTVAAAGMYVAEIKEGFLSARRLVEPDLRQNVNMIYDPAIGAALERTLLSVLRTLVADLPEACLTEPAQPSSRKRGRSPELPAPA